MSLKTNSFEFGNFALDVDEQVLHSGGKPVPLTPKGFLLLKILVENPGRVIEKKELMEAVWSDSFVEEGNLPYTANLLRKALGDSKDSPRFIETVPRRGYRFICPVAPVRTRNGIEKGFSVVKPISPTPDRHWGTDNGRSEARGPSPVVKLAEWNDASSKGKVPPILELALAKRSAKTRNSAWLILGALIGLLVAGAFGAYKFGFVSFETVPRPSDNFKISSLTSNGTVVKAALSPDGRFLAYVLYLDGQFSMYVENVVAGGQVPILPVPTASRIDALDFSPDGNFVYFTRDGSIFQVPVLGGTPKPLVERIGVGLARNRISFSPDGREFAFLRRGPDMETELAIAAADGSGSRKLASFGRDPTRVGSPAWSPDGSVIIVVLSGNINPNKIVAVDVRDGSSFPVAANGLIIFNHLQWDPDGKTFLTAASENYTGISDQIVRVGYPNGTTKNLTNDLNKYESVYSSADGRMIAALQIRQQSHIWVMTRDDAATAKQLTRGIDQNNGAYDLDWVSEAEIVYSAFLRDEKVEIRKIDSDTKSFTPIVNDGSGGVTVSPDRSHLVFQGYDAGATDTGLFSIRLRDNVRTRLTTGVDVYPVFSPDGEFIYFTRWTEKAAIWKMKSDGVDPVKLTDISEPAMAPAISPDGKTIAFMLLQVERTNAPSIALISADGGPILRKYEVKPGPWLAMRKTTLQWTPDGNAINFVSHQDGVSNIYRQPLDGGPPARVTNFTSGLIFNFAYSHDFSKLALSKGTYDRDVVLLMDQP